jgi:uncharacterized protein with HEPN domain
MRRDAAKYLYDIGVAAERIARFCSGRTHAEFAGDELLRSAVERQFEIIGEAMNLLRREAPELVDNISEHGRIIAFRNILVHGYAEIDERVVWNIVEQKLPILQREVAELLSRAG